MTGRKIEPTKEEQRNGWSEQTLSDYLKHRAKHEQRAVDAFSRPAVRPAQANNTYNPRRWD